jgi:hypothetical protein
MYRTRVILGGVPRIWVLELVRYLGCGRAEGLGFEN